MSRTSSSPSLTPRAQSARTLRIKQREDLTDNTFEYNGPIVPLEERRPASEQSTAGSVSEPIDATMQNEESKRTKADSAVATWLCVERTAQVTRAYERREERGRDTSLVRTSQRAQAVNSTMELAGFAAESTQNMEGLQRGSSIQMKGHAGLVERHVEESGVEKQGYIAEYTRLQEVMTSREEGSRIRGHGRGF